MKQPLLQQEKKALKSIGALTKRGKIQRRVLVARLAAQIDTLRTPEQAQPAIEIATAIFGGPIPTDGTLLRTIRRMVSPGRKGPVQQTLNGRGEILLAQPREETFTSREGKTLIERYSAYYISDKDEDVWRDRQTKFQRVRRSIQDAEAELQFIETKRPDVAKMFRHFVPSAPLALPIQMPLTWAGESAPHHGE